MERIFAVDFSQPSVYAPASSFPNVGTFVTLLMKNAFTIAGIICFFVILAGGFTILSGAGSNDPHKMEEGKKALTGALIGLAVIAMSFLIMQVITYITGLDVLKTLFQL